MSDAALSDDAQARRSVLKASGAGALLLLGAAVLAKVYFTAVDRQIPPPLRWVASADLGRARQIRDAIPEIVTGQERAAFLLGPSLGYYGFHPDVFDATMRDQGHDVVSYNLAVIGNIPQVDQLFARRLADAFAARGARAAVVMHIFSWIACDVAYLERQKRPHLRKRSLLMTPRELVDMFFEDPHQSSELMALRLFDGTMAADANHVIGRRLLRAPSWWPVAGPAPSEWERTVFQIQMGYARQIGRFDRPTRGLFNPLDGNTPEDYDRLKELAWSDEARTKQGRYWSDPDFVDAVLEPDRIAAFIETVEIAETFADAAVVIVPPLSPSIHNSDLGRERIAAAVAEIREQTGAPVVDLSGRGFVEADFIDFAHLTFDGGAPRFSRMLAEEVAVVLRDRPE